MEGASKPCPQCHIGSPLVVNIGIFEAPETVKQHDKNDEQNACFALVCMENTLKSALMYRVWYGIYCLGQ